LEGRPVPLTIPIGSGSVKESATPFRGVIDLLTMEAVYFRSSDPSRPDGKIVVREPIPPALEEVARNWREHLIDVLTEADTEDWITSAYLEGKPLAVEAMQKLVRRRTLANEIQPVFCGSGREHIGIQPLLDAICWYLPSPLDRPPVQGVHPKKRDKVEIRKPDPDEPFAALVFKIQADPHGELFYLRIYSGTVKANSRVLNPGKEAREFLTKLYHVHADPSNKEPVEIAYAGDIVAAIGPKVSITGDTLCDPQHPILLESIQFAETVVSMAIEPESSADKERLEQVLTILAREDPTFRWSVDRETGQTLMNGMGVLHLEIKLHRIREDFRLKVRVGKPRVSYRETIARPVRVWGECIRQTAAQSLFARLEVQFEHEHSREPVTFVNLVPPEILPPAWVSAIEQAIRGALQSGETGYPVIDVKVTLLSAQTHPTDSNELAFQVAAADAVSKALKNNVVLLEPVMRLEVTVPEQYLGPVTADLNARRAEIQQIHVRGNLRVIEAYVPLARMFDYADTVRSLTQGRASYTLEPYRYAPAPPEVLRQLLGLEGDGD
jgi:elongation factor G